ncbi:hypothetical protein PBY51_007620 [Eleginops maclovinus]|uniref:Uncharacterized protein n=1 Tax=Eleginops maclovinus TaxID=56733 RepID=A0AAN7X6R9_ELEMC|nr:hypothetical protein PBY51_007620 [Eleginops maclovinus]
MKRYPEKSFISLTINLLCLGILLITAVWIIVDNSHILPSGPPSPKKIPPWPSDFCRGCRALIEKVRRHISKTWKKQEDNYKNLSSQLRSQCQGFDRAILTQNNTPVGSTIVYVMEKKRTLKVSPEIFSTFLKEHPFPKKKWDTCAVVGNSGILTNSSCGRMIDSAQFVIRCNLPSLGKGYEKHVGTKTDIVTANPTIFIQKYGSLNGPRHTAQRFVGQTHKQPSTLYSLDRASPDSHLPSAGVAQQAPTLLLKLWRRRGEKERKRWRESRVGIPHIIVGHFTEH